MAYQWPWASLGQAALVRHVICIESGDGQYRACCDGGSVVVQDRGGRVLWRRQARPGECPGVGEWPG